MFKVGLTGNYYSGQQEIAKVFEEFGVPVFDGNLVLRYLINFSPNHIKKIKETFSSDYFSYGLLNFQKFKKNSDYDKLIDIVEFDLLRAYELFRLKNQKEFYTIFLFDWMFERSINKLMNFTILSYRPKQHRKSDLKYWTKLTFDDIEIILDNEMDEFIKKNQSDYIVQNYNMNGDHRSDIVSTLETQVKRIHKKIMDKKMIKDIDSKYENITKRPNWDFY